MRRAKPIALMVLAVLAFVGGWVGIPAALGGANQFAAFLTPVFAIARVAGWAAHIIEEQFAGAAPKPVLYRPESEYVGDYCGPEVCEFTPIEQRKRQ